MVVNDRYGFVFVHVPKVAGSSISDALRALPGDRRDLQKSGTKHERQLNSPGTGDGVAPC